ncbi:MAG TPA: hypothetical protein VII33_12200 [Nakamurella sp.]
MLRTRSTLLEYFPAAAATFEDSAAKNSLQAVERDDHRGGRVLGGARRGREVVPRP